MTARHTVMVVLPSPGARTVLMALLISYLFLELVHLLLFISDATHLGLSPLDLKIFHEPCNGQIYMSKTVVMT